MGIPTVVLDDRHYRGHDMTFSTYILHTFINKNKYIYIFVRNVYVVSDNFVVF